MSDKYKIHDPDKAYFITMTTVGWIDIFTRRNHKLAIVDSLKYCQENKGLEIYDNHSKLIFTNKFFYEKLHYIHQNPVLDMIVEKPEEYLFSSARNYADLPGLVDVILETPQLKTYV